MDIKDLKVLHFAGGEYHPQIQLSERVHRFTAHLRSGEDVMHLLVTCDALDRVYKAHGWAPYDLLIPYLPYGRQDRISHLGEAFGAKLMARLLNGLGHYIETHDPHSDVLVGMLDDVGIVPQESLAFCLVPRGVADVLIAPDAGASKKAWKVAKALDLPWVQAAKHRDTQTGQITSCSCSGDFSGQRLLIVDDLCDGGRSFVELAKVLRRQGAVSVSLYVTHGIFSKGRSLEGIDTIYCIHPWI